MPSRLRLLLPAAVLALVLAAPTAASAAGWTCEASAVTATVLTAPPIAPVTAKPDGACAAATAGVSTPAGVPIPLSLGGLTAATALDGAGGPVDRQTARAAAGVADVRVQSVPGLPITPPLPDLSDYAHVALPLPGSPEIDLRPALRALVPARPLPGVDLLHVSAAQAEAQGSCQGGAPRLTGSWTASAVSVNGKEIGLDRAVDETVRLVGSGSIDPSDIDPSAVLGLPPGLLPTDPVLRQVLESLPDVAIPATLARVRITPGERVQTGVRLTQRALHAEIAIAGQRLADVILGEATIGSADVRCGGVADLALACSARSIVLIDVLIDRGRVRLLGAADRRFAGRRVRIRSMWDGHTVARPRVSRTGLFRARAALPPAALRATNAARYRASIGGRRSLELKLVRRMLVTRTRTAGRSVVIAGRVIRPLASPVRAIAVKRRVSCGSWRVVKRFRPRADGGFRVRLPAPGAGEAAAYRMSTKVRKYDWLPKIYPTFTLPRYVDLA